MKTQKFETLLGGARAANLPPDAMMGLYGLARRLAERSDEDALFETALRRANEEELRQLARLRMDSANSRYLD